MENNYLVHHGILGQKWGVRRFQNKDGSLTEAGKRKYRKSNELTEGESLHSRKSKPSVEEMQTYIKKYNTEDTYNKIKNKEKMAEATNKANKIKAIKDLSDISRNALNTSKNVYKNSKKELNEPVIDATKLSTKELQEAVNRMNLEDNYKRLMSNRQTIQTGQDYVETTLDALGTVAELAATAASVALAINAFKK